MYVYLESEQGPYATLYTVGFYTPDGKWMPESDHESRESAAQRVHYLNGGRQSRPYTESSQGLQTDAELVNQLFESGTMNAAQLAKVKRDLARRRLS